VDAYGAPRYPELVVATRRTTLRRDPGLARALTAALAEGTRAAESDLPRAASLVAARADADRGLTLAQLRAVAPAFDPPLRLRRPALEGWARFDARFGILRRAPDVDRAFVLR
jgi:ABC-type nitrate/sulfonate/bicarbonate transport system substrate-binding protein